MADGIKVTIDDIDVTVPKGTFLIQAAKSAGIYISNFCAHPDMRPFGACRMCTVGVVSKWGLGFDISCATECKDGMVAFTENSNEEVREVKKFHGVLAGRPSPGLPDLPGFRCLRPAKCHLALRHDRKPHGPRETVVRAGLFKPGHPD